MPKGVSYISGVGWSSIYNSLFFWIEWETFFVVTMVTISKRFSDFSITLLP